MPLVYVGKDINKQPWFAPDRIGNFRHDAGEGMNMVVRDRNGVGVCGRVVDGGKWMWECKLEEWEWVDG